jgi:hypothetical protein
MRPSTNAAIYRPDLGAVVLEFMETAMMGFIGLQIMPLYLTELREATYSVIPKEVMLKIPDTARAARGAYNRGDWHYERGTFSCYAEHGWEEPIDDTERMFFDQVAPGTADLIATQRAVKFILRSQEQRIANMVFNPTRFTAHNVGTPWTDHANSTPIDDINDAILAYRLQCGMFPDALVISYSSFVDLKNNEAVVDRIKYTFPGIQINTMSSAQLAQIFNVAQVIIGGAVYDSAAVGLSAEIADLWNNEYAALVKISNGLDIAQPGIGRTFLWTADSPTNPVVEEYRDEKIRSDIFRCRHNPDECYIQSVDTDGNIVSDIAGAVTYLFGNVSASGSPG